MGQGRQTPLASGTVSLPSRRQQFFIQDQGDLGPATLGTAAPPRVIDKDAAYQRRGDGKEVGAVLPQYLLLIDKPEVCLVNQVRGLESLVGALTAQVAASLTTQFLIYHWNQPVQRLPVPVAPFDEHLRDISWRRLRHKTASREYVPVAFKSI